MSKKAFFIECSMPFWLEVAAKLQQRQGWQPVYWTGHFPFEAEVRRTFPGICFHSNFDAVKSIPPREQARLELPALDAPLLKDLAGCERTALRMMERMDPDESMTYTDRVRLFHRHIRYWQAVLDRYQPEIVLFPNSPHLIYDFVLYTLCKRRQIQTVLFAESSVDGLIYPAPAFEDCSTVVVNEYRRLLASSPKDTSLAPLSESYLKKVQGSYTQGKPGYLQGVMDEHLPRLQQQKKARLPVWKWLASLYETCKAPLREFRNTVLQARWFACQLVDELKKDGVTRIDPGIMDDALYCTKEIYKTMLANLPIGIRLSGPAPTSYLAQAGEPPEKAAYTGMEYWIYRLMAAKKKIRLQEQYAALARPIDHRQPYIYLALHYQPEKNTCPEGDVFAYQFLIADLLSKCAPAGWQVCVKEHPVTFLRKGSGELTRHSQFYDDLAALENVRLLPMDSCPFTLIDNARAVATVTGTTGWEGLIRGKPVLLFGHAWYKGCEGTFYVPSEQACRAALREIEAGFRPDGAKSAFSSRRSNR